MALSRIMLLCLCAFLIGSVKLQDCPVDFEFLSIPEDVTVFEGGRAFFPCTFNGTTAHPVWYITLNSTSLTIIYDGVGARRISTAYYRDNGTGLLVSDVNPTINNSLYACGIMKIDPYTFAHQSVNSTPPGMLTVLSKLG